MIKSIGEIAGKVFRDAPKTDTITPPQGNCYQCGKYAYFFYQYKYQDKEHCSSECKEITRRNDESMKRWNAICPPLYRETDIERIKKDSGITEEKLNIIRNWEFNPTGIILHGVTGRGKTRLMYMLLKKYHNEGYVIKSKLVNQFAIECITAFTTGEAEEWIKQYYRADILFLDDFGNQKFTDRMEDSLFSIIETRNANMLPTMVTSNYTGETLKEKISGDRADAILRRLREFSISVSL